MCNDKVNPRKFVDQVYFGWTTPVKQCQKLTLK